MEKNKKTQLNQAKVLGAASEPATVAELWRETLDMLNGGKQVKLTCIDSYFPKEDSYAYCERGLCKLDRIVVMSDSEGKLSIQQVYVCLCGYRVLLDEMNSEYLFICKERGVVDELDVDYILYVFTDAFTGFDEVLLDFSRWGIDTVKKDDGSRVSLEEYIKDFSSEYKQSMI